MTTKTIVWCQKESNNMERVDIEYIKEVEGS